jgi:hypothetical protein
MKEKDNDDDTYGREISHIKGVILLPASGPRKGSSPRTGLSAAAPPMTGCLPIRRAPSEIERWFGATKPLPIPACSTETNAQNANSGRFLCLSD